MHVISTLSHTPLNEYIGQKKDQNSQSSFNRPLPSYLQSTGAYCGDKLPYQSLNISPNSKLVYRNKIKYRDPEILYATKKTPMKKLRDTKFKAYDLFNKNDIDFKKVAMSVSKIICHLNLEISADLLKFIRICQYINKRCISQTIKDQQRKRKRNILGRRAQLYQIFDNMQIRDQKLLNTNTPTYQHSGNGWMMQNNVKNKIPNFVKWEVLKKIMVYGLEEYNEQTSPQASAILHDVLTQATNHIPKYSYPVF